MKIFRMIRLKTILLVLLALSIASLSLMTIAVAQTDENESHRTWEWNENGWRKRVEIRGRAEFTDDYTDIKSISEGGSVRIEETRDGTTQRMDITRDTGGQLQRTYYFNGQARSMDEKARAWLAGIMLQAVRQNAFDADKRIQRIFEQRGLNGVLQEISLVQGDYVKRIYFAVLIKNRSLNASDFQVIMREAARQISSDYEMAQLLIATSEFITDKNGALPAFFDAASTIKSDYERRRIFSTMLKKSGSNREVLLWITRSAASLASDYEKATVLKEAAAFNLEDPALAGAFFQTVRTITSDYEHRGVLSALLKRKGLGQEVLSRILESAQRMSSDYEKATLLLEASAAYAGEARLRNAFLQTVETIKSDYERGRVLSAMMKNKQIN